MQSWVIKPGSNQQGGQVGDQPGQAGFAAVAVPVASACDVHADHDLIREVWGQLGYQIGCRAPLTALKLAEVLVNYAACSPHSRAIASRAVAAPP